MDRGELPAGLDVPPAMTRIGIGLWSMHSPALHPRHLRRQYRSFADDAVFAESLGFASIWTSEHRFWYDGWCPALLHLHALAAAATTTIRFGSAVLLLPQHDAAALAASAVTLHRLTKGRVDLGVALGHRDTEFDVVGLRRDRRGRLMDAALRRIAPVVADEDGAATRDDPLVVLVGGMAPSAIARAARHGAGLILPPTLSPAKTAERIVAYRRACPAPTTAPLAMLRDVFVTDRPEEAAEFRANIRRHYAEEIGAWWPIGDGVGFGQPSELAKQVGISERSAIAGSPTEVAARLDELFDAGLTQLVVRLTFDFTAEMTWRDQAVRFVGDVAPLMLSKAAA